MRDPFDILGVSPDAEWEVILAAYRALARKYHPDTAVGSDAAEHNRRMKELNHAREQLESDLAGWRAKRMRDGPGDSESGDKEKARGAAAGRAAAPARRETKATARKSSSARRGLAVGLGSILLIALVAAAAWWMVRDEDEGRGASAPTPGITALASRATANVTPFPTPGITGNSIDSTASKGYTATFPEGWKVRANLIQTMDASSDVIFEPLTAGAKVQPNISINCIVTKAATQDEHITFEATKTARIGLNKNIVTTKRQISGIEATVLTYNFESQSEQNTPPLDKQDVFFSSSKCDWILTTTVPAGQRPQYQAIFDAFYDSFKLTS